MLVFPGPRVDVDDQRRDARPAGVEHRERLGVGVPRGRRAVRHAYVLGVDKPVMGRLVDAVLDVMGESYPELSRSHDFVSGVISREEERFRQTLSSV